MSEDAPQLPPPNESRRIDDPEQAHEMAIAGHEIRSQAAELRAHAKEIDRSGDDYRRDKELVRQQTQEFYQAAKLNEAADAAENEAGQRYELEKDRVQDLEKAHAMALAGDEERTSAVHSRRAAELYENLTESNEFDEETDPDGRLQEEQERRLESLQSEAETHDVLAEMEEDRVGNEFDANKKTTQIPVTETTDDNPSGRIEDTDKAHSMALAGNPTRTAAAWSRAEGYSMGDDHLLEDAEHLDRVANRMEDAAGRDYDEQNPQPKDGEAVTEHYDEEERKKFWTDMLSKYPPSEAYIREHKNFRFSTQLELKDDFKVEKLEIKWTPEQMVDIEKRIMGGEETLQRYNRELEALEHEYWPSHPRTLEDRMKQLEFALELKKEWWSLWRNKSTTLEDFNNQYKKLIQFRARHVQLSIAEEKRFLDDISSGRANTFSQAGTTNT